MTKNDSRESRAAEAERRRKLEGNTNFTDLGEPIQKLLLQISKDISDSEIQKFTKVTVRQLAKVFDMLALEEDPDKILAWLRREMDKNDPTKNKERDRHRQTVKTGASRDAIAFYKELEKKNIELMEKMKESSKEREEHRSANIAERKKRREQAVAEAAAAKARGEKVGETKTSATEKLTKLELADIVGTFDRFTAKQSTYDNSNANQDTEWWKQEEFRRDFEKNGRKGKVWTRVIQGGSSACPDSELAAREEWFRSQCWWKSDKFRRDWLASRDAEWWKEETYIRDWQDHGDKAAMWTAADEISGFNKKGDRRKASEAELKRRVEWYKNNGPKGIVKLWCALTAGSADRCTLEEKREREDFFKNGDWWKTDEIALQHAGGKKPSLHDAIFVAGAAGQDREWWKSEEFRQDFVKGGNAWKAMGEKAAVKGEDLPASAAEVNKREEWYSDNWWKAEKYTNDFKKNGANGKLWKCQTEADTAAGEKAKTVKDSEAKLRENWFATADDREWWKDEAHIRDWQENGKNGKHWQAGWEDASLEGTGNVNKAKAEELAKREAWFNKNWWKADKYVKDFVSNGSKGTAWKAAIKETHSDTDWWKEGDFIKQWTAAKKNDVTPFWQSPQFVEDYWKKGAEGKKWIAANAAAGSVAKGDQYQATPEELAEREAFYQKNWWRSPEAQRDFDANGRQGKKWTAGDAQGQGRATPQELKEREAYFSSKFTPAFNAMFEADATKHVIPNPAPFSEIASREEYFKKNWWKRPEVKADFEAHGVNGKLFKAATAEVAALGMTDKGPEFEASPADIAERKKWFESGAKENDWWKENEFHKEYATAKEPEFWKNTAAIDDYVKNGNKGTVWIASNAGSASVGKGQEDKATPEELKEREEWLKKNFWRSTDAKKDFAENGEKGTKWTTSEPNGKGQTVSDTELRSRMAFFRPTHGYESAEKPVEGAGAGFKVADCGLSEAQDREQWFEKNWWKSPEVEEDYRRHGVNGKLFKAATFEAANLGVSEDPNFQASPDNIQERIQYFETCDDRDWWKDPAVIEDYQKNGKEGAGWQSKNAKEASMSMGRENPATAEEIERREQWFQKNFWKTPAAVDDFAKNGKNGSVWKQASNQSGAGPASPEELQAREQWFETHKAVDLAELEARKEWFQRQLTDEEKIARREWVVKATVECKKVSKDELADVLAGLNDGQAPSQEQLAAIEEAVRRRRTELYGEEHEAHTDPDAITQEEFVTAVAETNFYVPQTEDERLRAEEEALEAMQAEEMARLQEEAEFLKLEAEEERAAAGEEWVDEEAAAAEEEAYMQAMEAENAMQAQPNEDDQQYTAEDEAVWQDFLENQGDNADLTPEQAAELQHQEEERLAAEAAREAAEAQAWQSEEYHGEEEYDPNAAEAGLIEENKEELEALVQDEGEGWGEEGEEGWEETGEEPVEEVIDELAKEEKGQPHQWKLPLRQVNNPQFLKSYFTVIKYTPSHSLLGGKSKRVWVVDHFTRCFYNLESSGKIKKEHAANKLLQLERNILDSNRLRLMFFDASHSYELQFQSPEERERFYETASAIRPSIRVYAPDLTNTDATVEACTTTIDGIGPEAVTVTCNNASGKPVQRELTGECKINASKLLTEPLTIWTGTFNMSGHPPPRNKEELGAWMPRDKYDIYAVAVQEASYRKEESEWFEFVQAYLGKDYLSLASMNLWDTLLIVLCRKKHLLKITNVEGSTKATIHKSVCGTKGGIGISLRYLETSICFVTAHLAARLERNAMRNTNLEEIFDCLQLGVRETDFCNQFNHVFFFGDLNYRIELDSAVAEKLIADKNYAQLLDYDQLSLQRRDEGICHGFQEPPITFAPTYRMQVGSDKYMAERGNAPSYCDRVLTRSMGNTWVKCTSYKSHPQVKTSEHLPVSATFIIRCVRPVMSCFAAQQSPVPMFVFKEVNFVESTGPIIKRPALMIQSPFSKIHKHVEAKTQQTATPFWDGNNLPKLAAVTQVQEFLETCHIIFIVREAAEKRDDKMHRGTAIVTLFGRVMGVQGMEQEFESDIMCHGKCIGKLVGKFHWEPAPIVHNSN